VSTAALPMPLARSLDPLPGESLAGYVLRLAHRQDRSPNAMTARIGLRPELERAPAGLNLGMTPEQIASFSAACRLTEQEARALTLADRLGALLAPDEHRTHDGLMPAALAAWISPGRTRWCPDCLRGEDGDGYWRLSWQVPWHYACLRHRRFLHDLCPECDNAIGQGRADGPFGELVPNAGVADLSPDACRHRPADDQPVCAHRLSEQDPYSPPPPTGDALAAQGRLDALLGLDGPADPDARATIAGETVPPGLWITALHGVVVLVRASLGLAGSPDLGPGALNLATYLSLPHVDTADLRHQLHTSTPPGPAGIAAALIPAALHVLDASSQRELAERIAPYRDLVREHRPGVWKSWLRQYPDPRTRALLKRHNRWTAMAAVARAAPPTTHLRGHNLAQRILPPHDRLLDPYRHLPVTDSCLHRVTNILLWQRCERAPRRADAAAALGYTDFDTVDGTFFRTRRALADAGRSAAYERTLTELEAVLGAGPLTDWAARRAALTDWVVPDDDWDALRAALASLQKRAGRQPDWALRRTVIGHNVWEDLTGSEPFASPAFRALTDTKARVRLRAVSQQFRINVATGRLPGFAPVLDAYQQQVAQTLSDVLIPSKPWIGNHAWPRRRTSPVIPGQLAKNAWQ